MQQDAPAFTVVEVEVNSRCNRSCGYCPVSVLPAPPVPRFMPAGIFTRLLEQLSEISFAGRLSYHLYNEPLLRRDLELLVIEARTFLPSARQVLYTNGDLLTPNRHGTLTRAGIDHFVVTRHDHSQFAACDNVTVLTPDHLVLTNRGGTLPHLGVAQASHQMRPCFAPSEMLIVTASGDVLRCYEDAKRGHVYGNIMQSALGEIWYSEDFILARTNLAAGERDAVGGICSACTNLAHALPGNSLYAL